jgi:hypothetical protein
MWIGTMLYITRQEETTVLYLTNMAVWDPRYLSLQTNARYQKSKTGPMERDGTGWDPKKNSRVWDPVKSGPGDVYVKTRKSAP